MCTGCAFSILLLVIFASLLAIPSLFSREGVGRRGLWLGAAVGLFVGTVAFYLWGPDLSNFFGIDPADEFNWVGFAEASCVFAAFALGLAGCLYELNSKEPGNLSKR